MELRSRVLDELSSEKQRLIKVVQIRDLRGLTPSFYMSIVRNARLLGRIKTVISTSMKGHPESIDTSWLLNVPGFFPAIWGLFSPLMNDNMRSKIRIVAFPHDPQILVDVGGLDVLLAMTQLSAEGLPCPGSRNALVQAGNFLDLAIRLSCGDRLNWDWTGLDLEFSCTEFKGTDGVDNCINVVQARRMNEHRGVYIASSSSICVFRWSNIHAWRFARSMGYNISLQSGSDAVSTSVRAMRASTQSRRDVASCCLAPCWS
mmetsp:Transcript_40937/g.65389  ORF Transcript_40937/g.65389 Transcript_40937/m.65389 type:complete len:260 (+) Transcript_40937:2-781(+)